MDRLIEHYNKLLITRKRSDINEHLPVLRDLGKKCKHITEFGVRYGNSLTAWMLANPKTLVCYDIQCRFRRPIFDAYAENHGIRFTFFEQNVLEATISRTDLLFIDTYHTYTQLKAEIERHSEKAMKYMVFHDTETFGVKGEDGKQPGLLQAIAELLIEDKTWKLQEHRTNENGLTILQRRNI